MLIKRLSSIKNVGRLVDCEQKGPELNHYNLFFAENGRGKTTLCAVLRSLKTGEPEHIYERTTVPITNNPEVSIQLDAKTASYKEKKWSMPVPDIEIFDATFVAQNIHAGEYVNHGHRKNLFQVIIGEEGGKIAEEIEKIDEASRKKSSDIGIKKTEIQRHLPNGVKLEEFLNLTEVSDIDNKIADKQSDLQIAQQAEKIRTHPIIEQLVIPSPPSDFEVILSTNLDNISEDIETRIERQIENHKMHEHGQKWISEGLGYIHGNACPFCGQNIKDLDLIKIYKQFFSEEYTTLIEKINLFEETVEGTFGDLSLARLGATLANNANNIQFWKEFVTFEVNEFDFENLVTAHMTLLRSAMLSLIQNKRKNPLMSVSTDKTFRTAKEKYNEAIKVLEVYNNEIDVVNKVIEEQKEKAKSADSMAIEEEIAILTLKKLRHNSTLKPLCDEYLSLKSDKEKLNNKKNDAKRKLDNFADSAISNCEKTINELLSKFGAGFSITKSGKNYAGGKPSSVYEIQINNHSIPLGDDSTPLGEICFRTTLSAGDKSALALAFFLARLEHDSRKADRIIVFDDPFSSQDRHRRECTANLLEKYGKQCAQLLLFCHDPYFLDLVYSKLCKSKRHCLQLSRAPNNTTTIKEWEIKKETRSKYFKDHEDLLSYQQKNVGDKLDIVRKIRPVLEGYLRYRFPNQFPDDEWLGGMIRLIRNDSEKYPTDPDFLEKIEEINDFSKKYHHDTNPEKADTEPINDTELCNYAQRTLGIVGGLT